MADSIAELEAALHEAKKQRDAAAKEELQTIPVEWEWRVSWISEHVCYVSKRLAPVRFAEFKAWQKRNPLVSYGGPWSHDNVWNGMKYAILAGHIIQVGGGQLVLKATPDSEKDPFSYEPRKLTAEEEQSLRDGNVPMRLRK